MFKSTCISFVWILPEAVILGALARLSAQESLAFGQGRCLLGDAGRAMLSSVRRVRNDDHQVWVAMEQRALFTV